MKYSLMILIILSWGFKSYSADSVSSEQKKAIQRLKQRKKGFEKYQKSLKERRKLRFAKAGSQKVVRAKYAEKLEKARKRFKRVGKVFPMKAYKRFQKMRNRQETKSRSLRKNYVKMKKELKKVHEKSRYKVNKMQEYEL